MATTETELQPGAIIELDPARVKPFEDQPRKRFRGIKQLAESIQAIGQVTPIVVTGCASPRYDAELVDGERRLRACLLGGMSVKAVLDGENGASDRYVRSVAANFCRQGHDAVEICEAVHALKASGHSDDDIGRIFGKSSTWVAQYASLRRLAPAVLEKLKIAGDEDRQNRTQKRRRGKVTLSVALLLLPLPHKLQVKAMRAIVKGKMGMAEARTHIHKLAQGRGTKVGVTMSDRAKFGAVSSAVENCYHVVERYLNMPGLEIKALVRGATRKERRALAKRLESLCESLLMLSDALDESD
jgi:ParB family chromosome partitioning protein